MTASAAAAQGQQAAEHGLPPQGGVRQAVGYGRESWARRFFEHWHESLKWQRLKPYEKFAEMIDRHLVPPGGTPRPTWRTMHVLVATDEQWGLN